MVKDPQTAGFGLVVSLFCRNQSQTKQWHRETGVAPAKAEISPSKKCNALVVSIVFLTFYCFQESFREAAPPEKKLMARMVLLLDWGDHCDSWHSPKRDRAKLFHLHGARLIEKQKPACDGTHFTDVGKFAQNRDK